MYLRVQGTATPLTPLSAEYRGRSARVRELHICSAAKNEGSESEKKPPPNPQPLGPSRTPLSLSLSLSPKTHVPEQIVRKCTPPQGIERHFLSEHFLQAQKHVQIEPSDHKHVANVVLSVDGEAAVFRGVDLRPCMWYAHVACAFQLCILTRCGYRRECGHDPQLNSRNHDARVPRSRPA